MGTTRENIINQAKAWIGCKESNGTHKPIIDVYNAHKPLARGYKVKYTDAWCATFVSACAIKCGATDIIPTECSCNKMISLLKDIGVWNEADNYTPKAGDIIFYDWDDSGKGDNTGNSEHVGIVEKVAGSTITVIEGNYSNSVKRRTLAVNGKYIRGYGLPKYTEANNAVTVSVALPQLSKGSKGNEVKTLQRLLLAIGYKMTNNGKSYSVDGSFGQATDNAVRSFQKDKGLEVDGYVGKATWEALLK